MKPIQHIALIALFAGAINMQAMQQQKITFLSNDDKPISLSKDELGHFGMLKNVLGDIDEDVSKTPRKIKQLSSEEFEKVRNKFDQLKKGVYKHYTGAENNNGSKIYRYDTDREISDMPIKDREKKTNGSLDLFYLGGFYQNNLTTQLSLLKTALFLENPEVTAAAANNVAILLSDPGHLDKLSNDDETFIKNLSEPASRMIAPYISSWSKGFIIEEAAANTTVATVKTEPLLNDIVSPNGFKKLKMTSTKTGSYDTITTSCIDTQTDKPLYTLNDMHVNQDGKIALKFSPDGEKIAQMHTAALDHSGNVSMYDANTGKQYWRIGDLFPRGLEYALDNKRLLVFDNKKNAQEEKLLILDAETGKELNSIDLKMRSSALINASSPIIAAGTSMYKDTLVVCYVNGIEIIDLDQERCVENIEFKGIVKSVNTAPDGKNIIVNFHENTSMTITKLPGKTLHQKLLIRFLALRKDCISQMPISMAKASLPLVIKDFPWIAKVLASYDEDALKELKTLFPIAE